MRKESARNSSAIPAALLRPTPRDVRLNVSGSMLAIVCLALAIGGLWAGVESYRLAKRSDRHVARFASEAVTVQARVVRTRQRGDNNRRTTVDYEYAVGNTSYEGTATVGGPRQERYVTGSNVEVTYLASEPAASWMDGRTPSRRPVWPAFAIPAAALLSGAILLWVIGVQKNLLSNGRSTGAVVTKAEKKRSDHGTTWQVEYKWTLLSGATRTGKYHHGGKHPPLVGSMIPIVYDRDQPSRNRRYPLSLVRVA